MQTSHTDDLGTYKGSYLDPPIAYRQDYWFRSKYEDKYLVEGAAGHYGYPDFPKDKDIGGNFQAYGVSYEDARFPDTEYWGTGPYRTAYYKGLVAMGVDKPAHIGLQMIPEDIAATAYSRMKPTEPEFSVLNSLYELRELPSLLHLRVKNAKDLAGLHLNGQFGWLATLADIRKFVNAQQRAQKRLSQLLRDNGRPVRRRLTLRDEVSDESVETGELWGYFLPGDPSPYFCSSPPTTETVRYTRDKIWASAQFRYWLPDGPRDILWKRAMMARLFGAMPTPQVVYNMIPWSWLVDWFSNLGDVIANLDAGVADRLAADRFYVMRSKERVHWANRKIGLYDQRGKPFQLSGRAYNVAYSKVRLKGSPFGVGLTDNMLSPMQLSILGALGLSRLL